MRAIIYGLDGKKRGYLEISNHMFPEVDTELIKRAFWIEMSKRRQPYGSDPLAGKRTSAHYHGRRGRRWSQMNRELARMKRIHNQGLLNFTARFVPQARKGRKAHPPKVEKIFEKRMNKKERRKALLSAIFASFQREWVVKRGHKLDGIKLPIVFTDDIQKLAIVKDVENVLKNIGLEKELERVYVKKIRAGKGKRRGRINKKRKGPLLIVKENEGIKKAVNNIPGVDVTIFKELTFDLIAPGGNPGRLCIWSESAIKELNKIL